MLVTALLSIRVPTVTMPTITAVLVSHLGFLLVDVLAHGFDLLSRLGTRVGCARQPMYPGRQQRCRTRGIEHVDANFRGRDLTPQHPNRVGQLTVRRASHDQHVRVSRLTGEHTAERAGLCLDRQPRGSSAGRCHQQYMWPARSPPRE
ncbi:hypothetical protein [Flexivirga aerilata]|uniref:hypothetical protein n=1 Tax=Flexivirga aerilata TaxID=1656889 RepID=UPI001BB17200|nr:hypothetical protein [Flexivirga aerilata]